MTTIEALLTGIAADGWRLVALSDQSVTGQGRWWATLHRAGPNGLDSKFGEAPSASEALFKAFCASATRQAVRPSVAPSSLVIESVEDGEGLDF